MELMETAGKGLYPITMASKLVGINRDAIGRWVRCFEAWQKEKQSKKLMWQPEIITLGRSRFLTFRDLVELRVISVFKKHKIGYRTIAALSDFLAGEFKTNFPLSTVEFITDSVHVYAKKGHNEEYVDILNDFILLPNVERWITKSSVKLWKQDDRVRCFIQDYERIKLKEYKFDSRNVPVEWCVNPDRYGSVCLNPDYFAGFPAISGIPTQVLFNSYSIYGNYAYVAELHDVSLTDVKNAVVFEQERLH